MTENPTGPTLTEVADGGSGRAFMGGPMKRRSLRVILALGLVLVAAALLARDLGLFERVASDGPVRRVDDGAGILSQIAQWETTLQAIFDESDVDLRLVTVKTLGGASIEEAAASRLHALRAGAAGREERGVVLFYDAGTQRLRMEIGYGLEEYFPDAFVSYFIDWHARAFFAAGDPTLGLGIGLRLLHRRIREAALGQHFDPTVLTRLRRADRPLSGGAGASAAVPLGRDPSGFVRGKLDDVDLARFRAGPTPASTHARYLEWLTLDRYDPDVGLFTEQSRALVAGLPMTRGYREFILLGQAGLRFIVDARGDLALLIFTDSPLTDPHFFRRRDGAWEMDIVAEVRNTQNTAGLYGWQWRGRDDDFTRAFADKLVTLKGYTRLIGGDNRELPTRDALSGTQRTAGWTPLHFAAARGQAPEVRRLLDGRAAADARSAEGRTPLYEAAKRGRLESVRLLVERGASIAAQEKTAGFTPLHVAAEYKHVEVVHYLLSRGADVNARNSRGQTPLYQAAWQAWHQDAQVAEVLYARGAVIDARDTDGFTPLHLAAHAGHAPVVEFLVASGADPDARTARGSTPLFRAAEQGHADVVAFLLDHAKDRTSGPGGLTPLTVAQQNGDARTLALLRTRQAPGAR